MGTGRQVLLGLLAIGAGIAWVAAGLIVVLALFLRPDPEQGPVVVALQAAMVVGWIATLVWLVRDIRAANFRFVLAPVVAWLWVWGVGLVLAENGRLILGP